MLQKAVLQTEIEHPFQDSKSFLGISSLDSGIPIFLLEFLIAGCKDKHHSNPVVMQKNLFTSNLSEIEVSYKSKIKVSEMKQLASSKDAEEAFRSIWSNNIELYEEFYIILLNRANKMMGWYLVSQGGTSGTVVDPKIIFSVALKGHACGLLLAHNHPSGNLKPSQQDIDLTKKLVAAGKVLEISVLDHIIISTENYYSFADEGLL